MKYIIKDWANNTCFKGKEFKTYEDAWEFLYDKYRDLDEKDFDDQMSEYSVEEA